LEYYSLLLAKVKESVVSRSIVMQTNISKYRQRLDYLNNAGKAISKNKEALVKSYIWATHFTRRHAEMEIDTLIYVFSNYSSLLDRLNEKVITWIEGLEKEILLQFFLIMHLQ
jgi:acyl-CoA reductase-like NAD-dependent aldehyde dehydrogenase